ncbi:flavin-containing monooxygenase [Rhodococcus daqingensis]|uniref:Flavin-containing monooxygenase n=1 Tax=Rhodococcus daqingensis TaxID=2479363 RepID=A0ABW2S193_9NOCA
MAIDHFDVLIVGAGLSGIGAGYHLKTRCPDKTYAILEARGAIGGTWDLFRYPGVRSDSDMYTLGYSFRPWTDAKAIADGPSILSYVRATAQEEGIDRKIRFDHRVTRAEWSSEDARWTVEAQRGPAAEIVRLTCNFLFMCSGYYDYREGYTPEFAGVDRFAGRVVHPQHWTDDIDWAGKRVVVIGSGATAVTLVPAIAGSAAHVTMLQRSPSYVLSVPDEDVMANRLRALLPPKLAYGIVRWKNVLRFMLFFTMSRRAPGVVKRLVRRQVQAQLPAGFDVDAHFTPRYDPWDQRMCFVPHGDLFRAIRQGQADIVTDRIETFTERGIRLASGSELAADIIVTATGLKLIVGGGVELSVDGVPVDASKALSYKGMMLSDVPNFASCIGYTNASWTLKCDLTCEYVCRLLDHMAANGYPQCTPRNVDPSITTMPIIDFSSGYVQRSIHEFPKQGSRKPWRLYQNYALDIAMLKFGPVEDAMEFVRTDPAGARRADVAG